MQPFFQAVSEDRFAAQRSAAGPWSPDSQHGGPPAALLTRAVERLERDEDRMVGRFTMELLGPVPLGVLKVTASVVRPGRSVELCEADLYDEERGRRVAAARVWMFPADQGGPGALTPLPHGFADGVRHDRPRSWHGGYLDAMDWRWISGGVEQPGPGVVWMRSTVELVGDEPMSPVQHLMACVDSASGVSAALDPGEWAFLNTDLSVHVLRRPVGDWLCLDAGTTLGEGRVGLATSSVYDERGLVARSSQALLVSRR